MARDDAPAAWLSSVAAAYYKASGDVASVAFVVVSYAALLLLLTCLRAYESGGRRGPIRRAVWSLSTLLTVLFAWRVAGVMPNWPAALLVWALAATTAVGGFVALFRRRP